MLKLTQSIARASKNNFPFYVIRINGFSTATPTLEVKNIAISNEQNRKSGSKYGTKYNKEGNLSTHNIVAAAFASLQNENVDINNGILTPFTDNKILNAATIDELLSISEGSGISRRHALKVVSVLANWSANGKVEMAEFEMDPRFIKLCRVLTKGTNSPKIRNSSKSEDLSTILSVTADDEAAKLVGSITLPQMVKVMSALTQKKRRSTLLLRALAFNITRNPEKLDLKQSADLLYSMTVLNFPEENLLERIVSDVCLGLESNANRSAVVGSILTSLGLLKYKHTGVLDALSGWIFQHHEICRPQDIYALFQTLAVLNFEPQNTKQLFEILVPQLSISETSKPTVWLEFVWSLVILNKATERHVASVLSDEFVNKIKDNSQAISSSLKLLNINAFADVLTNYNGPRLQIDVNNVKIIRSKEKGNFVEVVYDTLKNLMPSESFFQKNVDTGMGFYIDLYCIIDSECNPIAIENATSDHYKVAVMVHDYHDMCKGKIEQTGISVFASKVLEAKGFKILNVPYTEFKITDKLVYRVKYLETSLKTLISKT